MSRLLKRFLARFKRKPFQCGVQYSAAEIEIVRICLDNPNFVSCIRKTMQIETLAEAQDLRPRIASQNWHEAALIEGRMQALETLEQLFRAIAELDTSTRS